MSTRRLFPWLLSVVLAASISAGCAWASEQPLEMTTVYIVRHAEKEPAGKDPALTEAGRRRARHLAYVLSKAGLDAVFVRAPRRVKQTGIPVAEAAGLDGVTKYSDAADVAGQIMSGYAGNQVLVVGHSNTLDDIAAGFGVSGLSDLEEHQYDRLYVVHYLSSGRVFFQQLRYGEPTP